LERTVNHVTYQPHASQAMSFFGTQAKGIDVDVVSPGFARAGRSLAGLGLVDNVRDGHGWVGRHSTPHQKRPVRAGLQGLGDWFSDGVNALTQSGVSVIGAITGSTAQAEAQRNAVALANAQAARDIQQQQATSEMLMGVVPWVAGAVAVLGLGLIFIKKG
jgi:hypothetical protein